MLFKRFHTVRILNRDGKVYKAGWVEQAFNTQRPQYLVRTARDQYELADANRVVGHKIS